jgi:hypothetical protein
MKYSPEDIVHLKQDLTFQIDSIARDLLGSPVNRNQTRELKYGSKGGSLVVTVNRSSSGYGKWYDFQTGEGGDALRLIQKVRGLTFTKALEYAQQRYGRSPLDPQPPHKKDDPEKIETIWTPLVPVPKDAPEMDLQNRFLRPALEGKELVQKYVYRDQEERLLGYVIRLEFEDERKGRAKETLPLTWCRNQWGKTYWRWKGFEEPRPLYGLDKLKEIRPVLIVEGEKTADAAQALFPDYTILTWSGGTGSVMKSDWTLLTGRDVTLWPDHEKTGVQAVQEIAAILKTQDSKASVSLVDIPASFPPKWDLADPLPEGYTLEQIKSLMAEASPWVPSVVDPKVNVQERPEMAEDLSVKLKNYLEPFSQELFGEPKSQEAGTLFFGEGRRLILTRSGRDKGKWWDQELKKGGDILDLLMHPLSQVKEGIHSIKDKATYLQEWVEIYEKAHPEKVKRAKEKPEKAVWIPQKEVPADAPPLFTISEKGEKIFQESVQSADTRILDAYGYYDLENKLLGYRLSVEKTLDDGTLTRHSLPIRWCERESSSGLEKSWHLAKWEGPRPLFGLEQLTEKPEAPVLIVEGEKAALEARAYFPDHAVVSWMSHTSEFKTDWSPLKNRDVLIWRDNSRKASSLGRFLIKSEKIDNVNLVSFPQNAFEKWNFDQPLPSGWTPEQLRSLITSSAQSWTKELDAFGIQKTQESASALSEEPTPILLKETANPNVQPFEKQKVDEQAKEVEKLQEMSLTDEVLKDGKIGELATSEALASQKQTSSPGENTPQASPPYGQITAAAALGQLLAFPLVATAELTRGAQHALQKGIDHFMRKRKAEGIEQRQELADFYIRDVQSYTAETIDLANALKKSAPFDSLSREMEKTAQEQKLSLEAVASSEVFMQKFKTLMDENSLLKQGINDLKDRLSRGENKWKDVVQVLHKGNREIAKVWKEDVSGLHDRLKQSLEGIPAVDGKKLQEMARLLMENLRNLFARLLSGKRTSSLKPGL